MKASDRQKFTEVLEGVYALYRANLSMPVLEIWWRAFAGYELSAVSEALSQHCVNPDTGQYLPKPADVVKMMGGTTKDAALIAWAKVSDAVRDCGSWCTLVFDDAIIHRVVEEMGGWVWLCTQTMEQWPFVERRFCDHYRVYKARVELPGYPVKLLGYIDSTNGQMGRPEMAPVMRGDPELCAAVLAGRAPVVRGLQRLLPRPPA